VIADLHAHYPMHVVTDVESRLGPRTTLERMTRAGGRPTLGDRARAVILKVASVLASDRDWWSGYRISVPFLRQGNVALALSVLYRPFEEMDFGLPYGSPPQPEYFGALISDLERIEEEVSTHDPSAIRMARGREELERALADGATALVHCVEGGFHLGATAAEVERNVAELARRGVAYVTLAHLFFRGVATNTPALPFLPDFLYNRLFPQRYGEGLTELGRTAVRAMVRERVLVDVSHMRADALSESFAVLDAEDPDRTLPVIASHAGYRCGRQCYMLADDTIRQIARRRGVIGLIMAQHQLNDGIRRRKTRTLDQSFSVISRHIDRIGEVAGSLDHVALGSDFDGFIKPTMGGLEDMRDFEKLEDKLRAHYGEGIAEAITSGNALRVLRRLWPTHA
jgi:microsomal dipeptidase-like Zn-dependent dipeptidase